MSCKLSVPRQHVLFLSLYTARSQQKTKSVIPCGVGDRVEKGLVGSVEVILFQMIFGRAVQSAQADVSLRFDCVAIENISTNVPKS